MTENQIKWLEGLRSGLYKRSKKYLACTDEGFCCLGVWCEIKGYHKEKSLDNYYWYYQEGQSSMRTILNRHNADLLNLRTLDGEFTESLPFKGGTFSSLSSLNDNTDATFNEIADFIEANQQYIFKEPTSGVSV